MPRAMQQAAMCPDSWLWINLIFPALFFFSIFFLLILFLFGEEVAKGCDKDKLPSQLSSHICPRLLLRPLSMRPDTTSWPRALCGIVKAFWTGTHQDNRASVWWTEKNGEERQEETWQERDCRFKVSTSHSCCITRVRGISWMEVS